MTTLAEAKAYLRIDHDAEDAVITTYVQIATGIVTDYVGDANDPSSEVMEAATLMVLGELYENRNTSANPISTSVKNLLGRARLPGFA